MPQEHMGTDVFTTEISLRQRGVGRYSTFAVNLFFFPLGVNDYQFRGHCCPLCPCTRVQRSHRRKRSKIAVVSYLPHPICFLIGEEGAS
jgi:hypothetical protein